MATGTVCREREEQHLYCTVTFYTSESSSAPQNAYSPYLYDRTSQNRRSPTQISELDWGLLSATFILLFLASGLIVWHQCWWNFVFLFHYYCCSVDGRNRQRQRSSSLCLSWAFLGSLHLFFIYV